MNNFKKIINKTLGQPKSFNQDGNQVQLDSTSSIALDHLSSEDTRLLVDFFSLLLEWHIDDEKQQALEEK